METFAIVKNNEITLKKGLSFLKAKELLLETAINELEGYSYDKKKKTIYNTKTNVVIAGKMNQMVISEDEKVCIAIFEEL